MTYCNKCKKWDWEDNIRSVEDVLSEHMKKEFEKVTFGRRNPELDKFNLNSFFTHNEIKYPNIMYQCGVKSLENILPGAYKLIKEVLDDTKENELIVLRSPISVTKFTPENYWHITLRVCMVPQ